MIMIETMIENKFLFFNYFAYDAHIIGRYNRNLNPSTPKKKS